MRDSGDPDAAGDIVVIGGYGAVGRATASMLAQWFPGRVVIAGRDLRRAEQLARSTAGRLKARRVDVDRPDDIERVTAGARVVVMCVERANHTVASTCLRQGISYLDISASLPVLEAIEALHPLAIQHGATAALSVGLAPGLTNLLARHCLQRLPSATTMDITVLLGAAGDHGLDSMRWTVDHLSKPASASRPARRRVELPPFGPRTAYWFPFSDQYTLTRSLGIPVTTRLCFDSAALTATVFGARTAGLFTLARRTGISDLLTRILSRLRLGTDRFVVHAKASSATGEHISIAATGRQECRATAVVTAYAARLLYQGGVPTGVHHLDRLVEPHALLGRLPDYDIDVHLGN